MRGFKIWLESVSESDADDLYFGVRKIMETAPQKQGFQVYIHPTEGKIFLSVGDWAEKEHIDAIVKKFESLPGKYPVEVEYEAGPGIDKGWELIKNGKRVKHVRRSWQL
jgi:hypothetical protein